MSSKLRTRFPFLFLVLSSPNLSFCLHAKFFASTSFCACYLHKYDNCSDNPEVLKILKKNKMFLSKTQSLLVFDSLPFEESQKTSFTTESKELMGKLDTFSKDSKIPSNCTKNIEKVLSMEKDFVTKTLAMTEVQPNTKLTSEEIAVIKKKMKEIRDAGIDVLEVLHLIDIEVLYDEKKEKKVSDAMSTAKDNIKELELLTNDAEDPAKKELTDLIKLLNEFLNMFTPEFKLKSRKGFEDLLELYVKWKKEVKHLNLQEQLESLRLMLIM